MKRPPLYPIYLAGLLVLALAAYFVSLGYAWLPRCAELAWYVQLLPSVCLMGCAAAAHCRAGGNPGGYLLSYFLNAAASGWAIGALLGAGAVLPPAQLLAALLPAAVLGFPNCLYPALRSRRAQRVLAGLLFILGLILTGFGVYVWIFRHALVGCTLVFGGLFFLPFPIGCTFAAEKPQQAMRCLSFSGFGACFLIVLVVALILSEGELLDGLDFGGEGRRKRRVRS